MKRGVALFDLHHTLTRQNSFPMWIAALVGWRRTLRAFAIAGFAKGSGHGKLRRRAKETILRWSVRGATIAEVQAAGHLVGSRIRWRESLLDELRRHQAAGRQVVVATGAPEIYVAPLLRAAGIEVDGLIGTEVEMVDGKVTGRLVGPNCVREQKALRVAAWLAQNGPFAESWGYGNAPQDLPMLELTGKPTTI